MDEPSARIITRTSGMNPWRAGCGESRTSGSEGGPEKPTSRKTGRALRPDPYTKHPTREGKLYCCVVLDVFSRRVVGWSIDSHQATPLVTNALGMAIHNRGPRPDQTVIHSDSEYVEAGAPGLPDPHSDGRARMLVPGRSQAS
jgi:putative transposase